MLSIVHKLASSSQLHLGNPLSFADTQMRTEVINSPDATAFNIDPICCCLLNPSKDIIYWAIPHPSEHPTSSLSIVVPYQQVHKN